MMFLTPMPFTSSQTGQYYVLQYYVPQYHHSGLPYVGHPQQYSVQPTGPSTFYPGLFPADCPLAYDANNLLFAKIRIRDPNQDGKDITEEIMSGVGISQNTSPPVGRPCTTPTAPQVSHSVPQPEPLIGCRPLLRVIHSTVLPHSHSNPPDLPSCSLYTDSPRKGPVRRIQPNPEQLSSSEERPLCKGNTHYCAVALTLFFMSTPSLSSHFLPQIPAAEQPGSRAGECQCRPGPGGPLSGEGCKSSSRGGGCLRHADALIAFQHCCSFRPHSPRPGCYEAVQACGASTGAELKETGEEPEVLLEDKVEPILQSNLRQSLSQAISLSNTWKKPKEDTPVGQAQCPDREVIPLSRCSLYPSLHAEPELKDGKRQYDRDFLLAFQFMPACMQKPEGLPPISDVVLDKIKQNKLPLQQVGPRIIARDPGFNPASADFSRAIPGGRGAPLLSVGPRRLPPRKIITNVSVNDEVQLKKAENAWKPGRKRGNTQNPETQKTQVSTSLRCALFSDFRVTACY
ncbi:hypothetical protein P4O66_007899, partial [Electrophorus voltai]